MKGAAIFTADGRLNTKRHRAAGYRKQMDAAPVSYRTSSTKEELCFEYIGSFLRQFAALYPKRKLPYMLATNEYGVKKFVSTTVRPTQVPFQELYDMYECASFLAGYILYEPLDPPKEPPSILFSPATTLDCHTGDCFDLSTVLCSFLLGAGYDAYVVYGYAPQFITLRDQSKLQCPIIGSTASASAGSLSSIAATIHHGHSTQAGEEEEQAYKPIDNSTKHSVFLAEQAEIEKQSARDDFILWIHDGSAEGGTHSGDMEDKRDAVHAWVLVCAGPRELKEHVFIEPSTGRVYSTTNSPYLGIEAVWSAKQYYVNMQGFNGTKRVSEMTFDVMNASKWESLFASDKSSKVGQTEEENQASVLQDEPEQQEDVAEIHRSFDCPLTWGIPLTMTRQRYMLRFPPSGKRTVQYHKAKASYFARGVSTQSMTVRIVQYLDVGCTIVSEIHEWFENRTDKLYKRSRFLLNGNYSVEHYHPGSVGEVKTWTYYPAKLITVDFYVDGRLDRLYRREEQIGSKITEYFSARGDFLSTRTIFMTPDKAVAGARQFSLPGQGLAAELYILKIITKFEHDPVVDEKKGGKDGESAQVFKRVFFIREGKLITTYHFAQSRITGKVQTFLHTRGPSIPVMTDQALAQQLGLEEDPVLLQEAAGYERECFTSVKMAVQAFDAIVQARIEMEIKAAVKVDKSVFDAALDSLQKSTDGLTVSAAIGAAASATATGLGTDIGLATLSHTQLLHGTSSASTMSQSSEEKSGRVDYLAPFLRYVKDPHSITKEEALEIRQTCLDSNKARLVERANIIQSRLNDENAKLGRKQEQFQRSQREGDMSTEEYEKYCTEAMFRIQILEQRLASHEEAALKKFAELDMRLASDPRLKVLRTSER